MIQRTLTLEELEKNIIPRTHSNGHSRMPYTCDVFISFFPATKKKSALIRLNYRHDVFKRFKFITFYRVENTLYFKLSNENVNGTAYAISAKKGQTTFSTQAVGVTAEKLKDFAGEHFISQYDWQHSQRPIFYVTAKG